MCESVYNISVIRGTVIRVTFHVLVCDTNSPQCCFYGPEIERHDVTEALTYSCTSEII